MDAVNPECRRPDFRANPIPKSCSVLIYNQKIEKEEQARQKRINEMAESSLAKARMPSRMQKDQDSKSQQAPKVKQEQYSFKPKIGEMKTAEMFRSMQKAFESQLQRKKSQVSTTKPESPKFTKTKSRPLERTYVNEAPPQPDKLKTLLGKSLTKKVETQVKQPSSTRAMELAAQRRREEIEAKRAAEAKAAKDEQARKEKAAKVSGGY